MEPKKILLIEDNLETRELYREILEEAGFTVDVAQDGKIGLEKAEQGGYALIILDIMLPKIDGLALMGELQKSSPKPNSNGRIVLVTNLENSAVVRVGLKMGALDCIVKSNITPGQFVEKIKGYLK